MEPPVLDAAQLAKIQGTHRGFLYQHLYTAACLLSAQTTKVLRVRVERDEDVELVRKDEVIYAQIKTREEGVLAPSHIDGLLERFEAIRNAHQRGDREGNPRFALVANTELGPTLASRKWPDDVLVVTPATNRTTFEQTGLIPPPTTISGLLSETQRLAEGFRLSGLRPDNLVAKLVGLISRAAAGETPEVAFAAADLDQICELIAAQIRPLPVIPRYLPQVHEPRLPDGRGGLIVVGHPGDGKSAWASEVAMHSSEIAVYVPCSSAPGEQIAPRLVDAAVATLVTRGNVRAHELVLPGRTGMDALALLDKELTLRSVQLMPIVDDCHHVPAHMIIDCMRAAPGFRWLLLGRPSNGLSEVAALMGIPRETLGGWDDDVIAALLREAHCSTRPADVAALRAATNGAPLLVLQAVRAIKSAGEDTGEYARALVVGTTSGRTTQEILLEGAVAALEPAVGRIASALASIDIGLRADDWTKLISRAFGNGAVAVRRALRSIVDLQIAHETGREVVKIHDAFRPLLGERFLSAQETRTLREHAAEHLRGELLAELTGEHIVAYLRILASLGRLSELADLANAIAEWITETGTIVEVRGHLEACLAEQTLGPEDRFWALDTLAFFDIEENRTEEAASRLPEMVRLAPGLSDHARGALLHKQVLVAYRRGDIAEIRRIVSTNRLKPPYTRVLRYHHALAEADAGNVREAVLELLEVATEYLGELGLQPNRIFGKGPEELRRMMKADADTVDMRHLADCYYAIFRIASSYPEHRGFVALFAPWAMKFYDLSGAARSVLRAGQELVDIKLGLWGDPDAARDFLEKSLLPAVARAKLPEMTIPIRAQYAVVCAHCGDFAKADTVMTSIAPYAASLPSDGQRELENQRALIERLRLRGPLSPAELAERKRRIAEREQLALRLRAQLESGPVPETPMPRNARGPVPGNKVPRNAPCPCGSGKKYKKCCGG